MNDKASRQPRPPVSPQIEQLTTYLRTYPQDLIDARQLLHRFRVSAREFQHALSLATLPLQPSPDERRE